jgi:hypothetical protein
MRQGLSFIGFFLVSSGLPLGCRFLPARRLLTELAALTHDCQQALVVGLLVAPQQSVDVPPAPGCGHIRR